jgi:hypothetical protein
MCGAVIVLSGCGASLQQLKTRAAIDLDCDSTQLTLQEIDVGTQRVDGCGKRALYVQMFNNNRFPTWLLNSDIRAR